jgi:hypothetical protein
VPGPGRGTLSRVFRSLLVPVLGLALGGCTQAGAEPVSVTVRPEWVRVGGTAECGGPMAAEVVVPPP